MEKELEVARRLAREAGSILMGFYKGDAQVEWKGHDDPVTIADHAANEMLVRELAKAFPNDAILSEEAEDDKTRLTSDRVWMVDPMDGTKQFIEKLDEFAVMIGLAVAGEPKVGVVYNPATDRMFYAAPGIGAFVEEALTTKRLRVSELTDPDKDGCGDEPFASLPDGGCHSPKAGFNRRSSFGQRRVETGIDLRRQRAHLHSRRSQNQSMGHLRSRSHLARSRWTHYGQFWRAAAIQHFTRAEYERHHRHQRKDSRSSRRSDGGCVGRT